MKYSLAVIWPTCEAIAGIRAGETIRLSDPQSDLAGLGLSVKVDLPASLCPERELTFSFERLRDFRPDHLIKNTPYLANIARASDFIAEAEQNGTAPAEALRRLKDWPGLPVDMDGLGVEARAKQPGGAAATPVDKILDMVSVPGEEGRLKGIGAVRAALDQHLNDVLFRALNDPAFQSLEALWRSVQLVYRHSGRGLTLDCSILPVHEEGLEEALESAMARFVDDLPTLLILDCQLGSSPRHLELFRLLADLGQNLLVPCLCWIGPGFFHLSSWDELSRLPYLPHHLDEPSFAKWRSLIKNESCKWLGVTCNRFVLRGPYPAPGSRLSDQKEGQALWSSPVWALAALMARSMAEFGWDTHFSDWKKVRLEGLETVPGPHRRNLTTETAFTDERLHQMSAIRVMPLLGALNQDIAFTPVDGALSGDPFSEQIFASRVSQEFILCRESYEGPAEPSRVKAALEEHFAAVFAEHGHVHPERFEVLAEETPAGCRTRIHVTPSRAMLPSRRPYAMDLEWS